MTSNNKQCHNCKQTFVIEPEDFAFYEKIKVPPPAWCPPCRMQRRMAFRNERTLHHKKCDACKQDVVSLFSDDSPYTIYCTPCWYADDWDPLSYGSDFDPAQPFLEQFHELNLKVPQRTLINTKSINSEYTNFSPENKDCYMCISTLQCENCIHGSRVFYSRDCLDCLEVQKCELCYMCIHCEECSRSKYCEYSENLVDCAYCYDSKGLINCFGCVNLRNKSYHWLNQQLTKEEYKKKLESLKDKEELRKALEAYHKLLTSHPRKYARILNSKNCTGDSILDSKNSHNCYFIRKNEDSKYVFTGNDLKSCHDILSDDESELVYELMSGHKNYQLAFVTICWGNQRIQYSNLCFDSSNLFGCVGLRKKEDCILNKQYNKESFDKLKKEIIEQMKEKPYKDQQGREYPYGEFFPAQLSPFSYNETVAQEYFPLTKEEAEKKGYKWKELGERDYKITIQPENIPETIEEVKDSIVNEIIQCAHANTTSSQDVALENDPRKISDSPSSNQRISATCNEGCTTAFKIIPAELELYKRIKVPLPRLCPNCRHYQRLSKRNPLKLWHRKCMCIGKTPSSVIPSKVEESHVYKNTSTHFHDTNPCPNKFATSYAPDRKEIIYCETCYNGEVA